MQKWTLSIIFSDILFTLALVFQLLLKHQALQVSYKCFLVSLSYTKLSLFIFRYQWGRVNWRVYSMELRVWCVIIFSSIVHTIFISPHLGQPSKGQKGSHCDTWTFYPTRQFVWFNFVSSLFCRNPDLSVLVPCLRRPVDHLVDGLLFRDHQPSGRWVI